MPDWTFSVTFLNSTRCCASRACRLSSVSWNVDTVGHSPMPNDYPRHTPPWALMLTRACAAAQGCRYASLWTPWCPAERSNTSSLAASTQQPGHTKLQDLKGLVSVSLACGHATLAKFIVDRVLDSTFIKLGASAFSPGDFTCRVCAICLRALTGFVPDCMANTRWCRPKH